MANWWGNSGNSDRLFWRAPKSLQVVIAAMKLKDAPFLTPWKKSYDQPRQQIKKQWHYFANKGPSSQGYGFSSSYVWMWELAIKKAEHEKADVFELWCWRRFLKVSWTAVAWTNHSTLKEISLEYSLEGLMLKLQYFCHLMWKADSLEKPLMLGKIEGRRRMGK